MIPFMLAWWSGGRGGCNFLLDAGRQGALNLSGPWAHALLDPHYVTCGRSVMWAWKWCGQGESPQRECHWGAWRHMWKCRAGCSVLLLAPPEGRPVFLFPSWFGVIVPSYNPSPRIPPAILFLFRPRCSAGILSTTPPVPTPYMQNMILQVLKYM